MLKRLLCIFCALCPFAAFANDVCPAGYYPDQYIQLEYIESTGTQWIDTGHKKYTAGHDYRIVSSVWFADIKTRQVQGCQDFFYFGVIDGYWQFAQGTTGHVAQQATARTWYDVDALFDTANNFCDYSINGESFTLHLPDPYMTSKDGRAFAVFSLNDNTLPFGKARVKNYVLYDNGVLVRDFIPVRRITDGAVGMFDRVEGRFYGNDGTGEFIAGPEFSDAFIVDENGNVICALCPANTYKPNAGNENCTACPTGTFSPIGSTALSDCAKILNIGNYVVYMPIGKHTDKALCMMTDDSKVYCADVYEKQ